MALSAALDMTGTCNRSGHRLFRLLNPKSPVIRVGLVQTRNRRYKRARQLLGPTFP